MRHLNHWMFFLEVDCNAAAFDSLQLQDPLRIFLSAQERSDFSLGVNARLVVAVLHNQTVLYQSQGFNLSFSLTA